MKKLIFALLLFSISINAQTREDYINYIDEYTKYKDVFETEQGSSNEKYINPQKGFESYFLHFDEGTDLELMSRTDIQNTPIEENRLGLTHFAFAFDSQEAVLRQTERLRTAGYTIAGEPRTSGDGYFESVVLDPDGNRIECVFRA
jgi:putative acetyltransferase